MKQSESISNLSKALVAAQKLIQAGVVKNQQNDTFSSSYADLGAVIGAVKGALNEAGLVVIQSPTATSTNGFVHLTTRLMHLSGEWLEDTATAPLPQLDPQGFGSAISYLRRYALLSMMGLYGADDDDGEGAAKDGIHVKNDKKSSKAVDGDGVPIAIKKRSDQWLGIIKTADADQLARARSNAANTFQGSILDNILSAIEMREQELTSFAV